MRGSAGADTFFSHSLVDDKSADRLLGFGGRDTLYANDGRANDLVNGGAGFDFCYRDANEAAISCEVQ
jgi:Ca2+-binding RTX toxin-like protein